MTSPTAFEPAGAERRLLVVVPCLDEQETVADVVAGVPAELPGIGRLEIVVIDDGSTDETAARAAAAGAEVIRHRRNLGLGRTFRHAVRLALDRGADLMVHIDGDGQFDPAQISAVAGPVIAGEADMATASRFADRELVPRMPAIKRWGNRRIARVVRWLTGRRFADVSCGFRAYSREALLRLNLFGGLTYTQETFLDLAFKGLAIVEVPLAVRGERQHGRSRVAASVPRYAVHALAIMLRAFAAYRPFAVFSSLAALFALPAIGLLGFLLAHYMTSGSFSPHIWAGFVGGSFAFLAVVTLVLGLLGDLLVRLRRNQEEVLYHLERRAWEERRGGPGR